jgi:radical SAM superfamily enzyme YgiQ (UPF0313 family)
MKTVIAALNSKFVHMSLAPWYLKAACDGICRIKVLELTINQEKQEILRRIYIEKPDVIAFSCYIFNITLIESIVKDIKLILPNTKIIFGGPEVSYDAGRVLENNPDVDFVICGEGEFRLPRLLAAIKNGEKPEGIDAVSYRDNEKIVFLPPAESIANLDDIPSPYTDEMLAAAKGKIAYFESSRGCPFHCAYCLSPQTGGVRRFGDERIKHDLLRLMNSDARQIKFVDRTFNCNKSHAKRIISFILEKARCDTTGKISGKNYHFEAAADLFDDELIELLSSAPSGLFQLEIGIQSFNEKTLAAATRKTDLELCEKNIKRLIAAGNMHIHLDLIAGLPYEDFASFAESFNSVFALQPHCIQLGFLKLLRGSGLWHDAQKYGIVCSPTPPYEVLSTPWLSYDEILKLKDTEAAVDSLYNSGRFVQTLRFMVSQYKTAFSFFFDFSQFLKNYYPDGYGIPSRELYNIMLNFADTKFDTGVCRILNELLKYDFYASDRSCNPPSLIKRQEIPGVRALYDSDRSSRGHVHYERFSINPVTFRQDTVDLKFDYKVKNPVTGLYKITKI